MESELSRLASILNRKAAAAKRTSSSFPRKLIWENFWSTKDLFNSVRYGWALTCHRAQGSTYDNVFIEQYDILSNKNPDEAHRCLYVAESRASKNVHTY